MTINILIHFGHVLYKYSCPKRGESLFNLKICILKEIILSLKLISFQCCQSVRYLYV